MEYTVKQLADLAGITPRTLRYYDRIGLLAPSRTTAAGYRLYGPHQVDRLQHILFYRELEVPLDTVARLLDDPDFHSAAALQGHLAELEARQARLAALILTVKKTWSSQKGERTMSDKEKFEGFKENLIGENEEKYGKEIRAKYGHETVEAANAKMRGMTQEQYWAMTALEESLKKKLNAAVRANADPAGEVGLDIAMIHKTWLGHSWEEKQYSREAHRGLAELYVGDGRLTDYYDKELTGCAAFLRASILAHI